MPRRTFPRSQQFIQRMFQGVPTPIYKRSLRQTREKMFGF